MKIKFCAIVLSFVAGCSSHPVAPTEPFTIQIAERPSEGVCEGSYLIITYLEPSAKTMEAVWGYEATGAPGKYKVHYSKRTYALVQGECQTLDEVYIHGEQSISVHLEGGHHYLVREASGGKAAISKSKM